MYNFKDLDKKSEDWKEAQNLKILKIHYTRSFYGVKTECKMTKYADETKWRMNSTGRQEKILRNKN